MAESKSTTEPVPSITPLIGRDEMNLAEMPHVLLGDSAKPGQKTLWFKSQKGKFTVTGSDAYGLPTAYDADVLLALLHLTKQQNNYSSPTVFFSRYQLIQLLGWRDTGDMYKRLDQSFNRWSGVLLVYDDCWWDNRRKEYISAKMHIIESVKMVKSRGRKSAQNELALSSFKWNDTFFESCQNDNLRQLNLDVVFSLKSAAAKQLYRFLGKRFYLQSDWTFDLNELAFERVGLSRNYQGNAGKIKEKLQPAIDELEAIGFLRPLPREKRYTRVDRSQWAVHFARQAPAVESQADGSAAEPPSAAPAASPLVAELTNRGVSQKTALELVAAHHHEAIALKIEQFDFLAAKQDPKISKSPSGYLRSSIIDDYASPKGFVSQAELKRRQEAKEAKARAEAEARRHQAELEAADRKANDQADAFWNRLEPEVQARIEAEALAAAGDEAAETYRMLKRLKAGPTYLAALRRDFIRKNLLSAPADESV